MKKLNKIVSLTLCFLMTFFAACVGNSDSTDGSSGSGSQSGIQSGSSSGSSESPIPEETVDCYGNWTTRTEEERGETVTVTRETLRDKVLGSIVGNVIGLGSGFEYVHDTAACSYGAVVPTLTKTVVAFPDRYWEPGGQVCSGSIGYNPSNSRLAPICDPRVYQGKVISDDDIHVDIANQLLLHELGATIDAHDVAHAWSSAGFGIHDAGGGQYVRNIVDDHDYIAPYSGQQMYGNSQWFVTEGWIESDMMGLNFPYMTSTADAYSRFFTTVNGDGNTSYLGRLCLLMTSLSFQYDDAKVIIEKAFDRMDRDNEIYDIYQYILKRHGEGADWRTVCVEVCDMRTWIYERPETVNGDMISGGYAADFSMSANAGMILIGLIYGNNDFEESIKITSLCGLDGDCTAATVGQIVGNIVGFDAMPQKYKNFMNGDSYYYNYTGSAESKKESGMSWGPFAFCDNKMPSKLSFNQIADITMDNIEAQIIANGGSVNGNTYNIASQKMVKVDAMGVENRSFENGTNGWSSDGTATFSIDNSSANLRTMNTMAAGKLTGDTSKGGRVYQTFNLKVGNRYRASIYLKRDTDREVRVFANDKYNSFIRTTEFKGYTPSKYLPYFNDNFYRLDLYFTAEEVETKVGIEMVAGSGSTGYIVFDDFELSDISHISEGVYQGFNIEQFYASNGFTVDTDNSVNLSVGQGIRFEVMGYNGYQTFKVFAKNHTNEIAKLHFTIDNRDCGVIPVQKCGNIDFNEGCAQMADLYLGEGKHVVTIKLSAGSNISINKVEVYGGNPIFTKS